MNACSAHEMNDSQPLLELTRVAKRYDAPDGTAGISVLKDISLRMERGEALAIVGPSGSGKSTLLNIIGTLDRPTSGDVWLSGRDVAALCERDLARLRACEIGFVFQQHHLLPQCTVLENVLVPTLADDAPQTPAAAHERARRLLERVGLSARLQHAPGQLSGGECQRVAVARALINTPTLLLADEPTGSLDLETADTLGQLLIELNREENVALIVVTHAAALARRMARQFTLRNGMLVA